MKTTQNVYRWLTGLALAVLAIGCSDQQLTSPDSAQTFGPAFSLHSSSSGALFGTNSGGGDPRGSAASTLYTIDATTGAATAVGPTGFNGVGAIAFAANGTLYGISSSPFQLITINVKTGVGSLVGSVGGADFRNFMDLSFRNGDGVLFAVKSDQYRQIIPFVARHSRRITRPDRFCPQT